MNRIVRIDVALAFALVFAAGYCAYFPFTFAVAIGVSMLTLNRWGTPSGSAFGVKLAFLTALWASAGVCGSLARLAISGGLEVTAAAFTVVLALGLSYYGMHYLSRRVNAWWPASSAA